MASINPFNYHPYYHGNQTNFADIAGYDIDPFHLPVDPRCLMAVDDTFGVADEWTDMQFQTKDGSIHTPRSALEILNFHRERMERNRMLSRARGSEELSTDAIIRLAAAHFIQLSSLVVGDPSELKLPFGLSLSTLKASDTKNVQLVSLLLSAAEKVNNQQYDRASKLVEQCYALASKTGNPVERVVYYFVQAIREKIDRETGKLAESPKEEGEATIEESLSAMLSNHPVQAALYKRIPFTQLYHFATVQTMLDRLEGKKRIHIIDFSIKHGLQWTIMMQALVTRYECPIESLTISAVGADERVLAVIGKRLAGFARSLGLPFEFRVAITPNMKDLRADMFEIDEGEALAIYSALDFHVCLVQPESLENLLRVIRKLRPTVMTVVDTHGKMNSRCFINRFTEALFYFGAYFDAIDHFLEKDDPNRMVSEGYLAPGIKSIIASEGRERVVRHVGVGVWRSYFSRFGLVEDELSEWAAYQAGFLLKQFDGGHLCTLARNGKSLLIGWKGTPLLFVSVWKFQQAED